MRLLSCVFTLSTKLSLHDPGAGPAAQARGEFNIMLTIRTHSRRMLPASTEYDPMTLFNARAAAAGWGITCGPAQDFEHAALKAVLGLWREKARGREMPGRADMTARAMKPYMTHMSLLERVEAGRYRIRLHGSVLAAYAGDGTGKFLDALIAPRQLESFTALYDTALALRVPVRVVSFYQTPKIAYLVGESLLAPLAAPGGATPILLSVTYAEPRTGFAAGQMD
jgi:hypothetical protein